MNIPTKKLEFSELLMEKRVKIFHLGHIEVCFGMYKKPDNHSFFIETISQKGEYIFMKRNIFQKIKFQYKIRLAYHTQRKTLKKA